MSKELVIGSNHHETKVAILEEDQLVEIYFQRANAYSLAGSIHKGRVTRVLPGMQSAFVDLGLERDTFLYVSDFFDENEDIDTVTDDKPNRRYRNDRTERADRGDRSDRRDRGVRLGPERESGEREGESRESRSAAAESTSQSQIAEDETGLPARELLGAAAPPPERRENGTPERIDDRPFRGDRRNRRGRRRRQRGPGFPDNKYAQPIAPSNTAADSGSPEDLSEDTEDVIILPGESLAKYRRMPSGVETSAGSQTETRRAEEGIAAAEEDDTVRNVIDPAEQAAIEDEADELELSEKVLAHHDDETDVEVEEKIEEVKHDQPVPPPVVSEGTSASASFADDVEIEPTSETSIIEVPEAEGISAADFTEARLDAIPEGEASDADHSEKLEAEVAVAEARASHESNPEGQPEQAQTATVRDQSGRYMHRVSRRMRRRRGANRFSHGSDFVTSAPATGGAAAAPALETEARRDTYESESEERAERTTPSISDLLKPGQEIIVQIAKEPLGQKGARITSHIALPGRYVVFMPSVNHMGVSRRIASEEERQRLKRILQAHRVGTTGGFIVRTAGEGIPEEDIASDMNFLYSLWLDIRQKAEKKPAPVLLHYDLDIVQRVLRDQVTEDFKAIWVDNEEMYENVLNFMQRFQPSLVNRVKMYTRSAPIFDAFNITQELEKALRPKVWLKSGGYIVINQTEALVAIDINTGKYVGKSNRLEDTIVKTNIEAVKEIVRQIRLRDLGGIIVVDFIDMDERKNRQKVMQALEETMRADRAPYKILQFNDFGLVAITRKRVKQSLERTLCAPCPYCEGAGYVKSVQTIISEILQEAQKIAKAIEGKDVMLRVHPDVAKVLKASSNQYLEELEEILGRPVLVTGDATLHHEKFDLA
jgi:ribonuclease G